MPSLNEEILRLRRKAIILEEKFQTETCVHLEIISVLLLLNLLQLKKNRHYFLTPLIIFNKSVHLNFLYFMKNLILFKEINVLMNSPEKVALNIDLKI